MVLLCYLGRWPVKSASFILDLLKNAESNAEVKGLDVDSLFISHIQVNQAHRNKDVAHIISCPWINPYISSPCHIELILSARAWSGGKGLLKIRPGLWFEPCWKSVKKEVIYIRIYIFFLSVISGVFLFVSKFFFLIFYSLNHSWPPANLGRLKLYVMVLSLAMAFVDSTVFIFFLGFAP
ncbi:unnamed protein product [Coffea canephora]|uniref:60S ribosomal protein L17 n=1 Tax=Coffea canephora TaxID=49390 RepID=A0A068V720_COFCA|nr:unnamed protein product [Coffea canephora]